MKKHATVLTLTLLLLSTSAYADTIAQYVAVTESLNSFVGQSVTTAAAGGPWNNIIFNWYSDRPATIPTAFGTLFLLNQEYHASSLSDGTPAELSSSTTGYIAEAVASGGQYTFAAGVTLAANTQYFFYTNASGTIFAAGPGTYSGGVFYTTAGAGSGFVTRTTEDVAFLLQGTPVNGTAPVPEPASFLLIGSGIATVMARARKRRAS
jgi:hypothetical protein